MSNLSYKTEETTMLTITKSNSIEEKTDKRKWVYIDLEEHDEQIRRKEQEEFYAMRKRERDRRREYQQRKKDLFLATLIFRVIGLLMIFFTALILAAHIVDDGTWSIMFFAAGMLLVLMPGYNKPKR
jgi:hypothetical protein